jgi:YhcH/YjgK/YiaL family protein
MILDVLTEAERYGSIVPGLAEAFAFLRRPGLAALADGRYPIAGERLYAMVARTEGRGEAGARLEYHRRYLDVQFCVSGTDVIGWKALGACTERAGEYDAKADCGFYGDAPAAWVRLPPGAFMLLLPSDAHAPLAGVGLVHKVVVKLKV